MLDLKSEMKELARFEGATMVGIASVARFSGAPEGHGPTDFIKEARSVIVVGIKIPDPIADYTSYAFKFRGTPNWSSDPLPTSDWIPFVRNNVYLLLGHYTLDVMLNIIATKIALKLEGLGYKSMPTPSTGNGLSRTPGPIASYFSPFSHRHAAVRAGLGEFGFCDLVMTPEFGPRVRFTSVITEAALQADPLISEKVCLRDKCDFRGPRCLQACPVRAIQLRESVDHSTIFVNSPSKTDARLCYNPKLEENSCIYVGECMRACPVGTRRCDSGKK